MNKVIVLVGGAALVASVVNGGCLSEDEACPTVTGQFYAVHQLLDGSCSAVPQLVYEFEDKTLSKSELSDTAGMVRTEVNRMGCTLKVTRTRLDNENKNQWQMTGNLDVANSKKLTGKMTRYEWGEDGQIVCQGNYNVTMSKVGMATEY